MLGVTKREAPGPHGEPTMESAGWDIVVAGAGPAGSRVAELLASRGVSVLLLDPKAPWEKPCGGGLTAAAMAHTPELKELEPEGRTIRELVVMAPSGAGVVIPLRRPYVVVARRTLSSWGLRRAEAAGARFVPAGLERCQREQWGWSITDTDGRVHRTRWLVGADGATSRIRRVVAPRLCPELAPTRVFYPEDGVGAARAVFRFLPAAQGYLWDFPRPDRHSLGIGVAPGTFARDRLDEALAQHRLAETGASDPSPSGGAVIATSAWESGSFGDLGGVDYALLGDAAGLADPATGEGIDYALRSAALAAAAFSAQDGFTRYPEAAKAAFRDEIRRARWIRRWLYHPGLAEQMVRQAQRSPRRALVLMAFADAINEHGSLRGALWRVLARRAPDFEVARAVCDCAPGGGSAPPPRSDQPPNRASAGGTT